jgi:hypothetical protein
MRIVPKIAPVAAAVILATLAFYPFAAGAEKICRRLSEVAFGHAVQYENVSIDTLIVVGRNCANNSNATLPSEVCQTVLGYAKYHPGYFSSEDYCSCELLSPTIINLPFDKKNNPTETQMHCEYAEVFTSEILLYRNYCTAAVKRYFGIE